MARLPVSDSAMTDSDDKPNASDTTVALHLDGYIDTITAGGSIGASPRPWYAPERELDSEELYNAYENDAVAARIIDQVVDDAIRSDWDLVGLDKAYDWASVKSALDDHQAMARIGEAWRWSRLQRGALLVMAIDDGKGYDEPLALANVKALRGLTVVDATRARGAGFDMARGSAWRSDPEFYELSDPDHPEQARVHRSRVIRFDGVKVPPDRMLFNSTWGPSVLQRCWRALANYANTMRSAEAILRRISVMVLKMDGWRTAACGSAADKAKLQTGLREMWWGIDNFNLLVLDKEDEFGEVKRSVEGVKSMMDAAINDLVMASGTTRLVITGEQTSTGLNSDSKGERRQWYDHVTVQRRLKVTPALNRLLEVEFAARRNKGEQVPDEWEIDYEPLESEAQPDKADRATKWSAFVQAMIDAKVISPAEGRRKLIDEGIIERTELGLSAPPPGAGPSADPLAVLSAVSAGTLPAASAVWLISKSFAVNGVAMTDSELAAMKAAVFAASDHAPKPAAATPGQPEALDEENEIEAAEPDPVDLALAELPKDLMTPEDLVEEIKRQLGFEVTTRRVHSLAKRYHARSGRVGNQRGYSLADIKAALLAENEVEIPALGEMQD